MPRRQPPDGWQALAEDAEYQEMARGLALSFGRRSPWLRDDLIGVANLALCRGVTEIPRDCRNPRGFICAVIHRAILTFLESERPRGYRRPRRRRATPIKVHSLVNAGGVHCWRSQEPGTAPDPDEWHRMADQLADYLNRRHAAAFLARHSEPEPAPLEYVCEVLGCSPVAAGKRLGAAYQVLRRRRAPEVRAWLA